MLFRSDLAQMCRNQNCQRILRYEEAFAFTQYVIALHRYVLANFYWLSGSTT